MYAVRRNGEEAMTNNIREAVIAACAEPTLEELADSYAVAYCQFVLDGAKDNGECFEAAKALHAAFRKEAKLLSDAVIAMAEDGWLIPGPEGMSESQQKCYDAYLCVAPKEE